MFSITGGYQENLVVGGAGSIAQRVADELGDAVRLNTPVRAITQKADHVVVESAGAHRVGAPRHRRRSRRRWRWRSRSIPSCRRTA